MAPKPFRTTAARRQIGRTLTTLHKESGLGMDVVAARVELSSPTIWKMLGGKPCRLKQGDMEKLCQVYGASPETTQGLRQLVTQANATKMLAADGITSNFDLFVGLEAVATDEITYGGSDFVHGLLQTDAYARKVIGYNPDWTEEMMQAAFEVRKARQSRLVDAPTLKLDLTMDEGVFLRPMGGPGVMAEQLQHLADMAVLPNVTIRVLPLSVGMHRGLDMGMFVLLDFAGTEEQPLPEPPIVYIHANYQAVYLEKPEEIARYRSDHVTIAAAALDEGRSRALILKRAKDYEREY